jgi:hypothetical protein
MKRIIFFPRKGLTDKGNNCLTVKQKPVENAEQCFIAGPFYFGTTASVVHNRNIL